MLGVTTVVLILLFTLVMVDEKFCIRLPRLLGFSTEFSSTRKLRNLHICCFITIMSISSVLKLGVSDKSDSSTLNVPSNFSKINETAAIINETSNRVQELGECERLEYVVFTWVLCLVAITSVLNLYYLIKTFIAFINCIMYFVLLIQYYNFTDDNKPLPMYVRMLILITIFLMMVIYHSRLVEVMSRLEFVWKQQAETNLSEMVETHSINKVLLRHIQPDHVVKHFLNKNRCSNQLYSQFSLEVGVMFAGIANFHEFYSDEKGVESMRLLNEIISISCGPLVGEVMSALNPVYDIWWNTFNEASRMESTGAMDMIQVTKYTKQLLERRGYGVECRGMVEVKGKDPMETWWVVQRPEPTPGTKPHSDIDTTKLQVD